MIIRIPTAAKYIIEELEKAGHEAYIVGGCVRDAILNRVPGDWDITTSALPMEVKAIFRNTVDTGIQHGTVMIIRDGDGFEVTTYRVDGEYEDNRHPKEVTFTRSLEEDLKRRDFTINAFAYNPKGGKEGDLSGLVDLFNGIEDLNNEIIRCVGNPDERFDEDALRIMRAVRFSAQLGFVIESETRKAITTHADNLADISMERIRVEFEKTITSQNPTYVNQFCELGLAKYIVPSFNERCFDKNLDPLLNILIGEDKALLLAAFFSNLLPEEADQALRYLKYDNKTRIHVVKLLKYKDSIVFDSCSDRVYIKKLLNEMGIEILESLIKYKKAEILSGIQEADCELDELISIKDDVLNKNEPWCIAQLAVNGRDLIKAGLAPGAKIGETLEKLLEIVIAEPDKNEKESLLSFCLLLDEN